MQRHKMQITRRNNQIENETEQNAIKVDDEPNGNCSTKATQQHTIARAQGHRTNKVQVFGWAGFSHDPSQFAQIFPFPSPFDVSVQGQQNQLI